MSFATPILFQIFNRLATAERVFEEIRKAKLENLYIVHDGTRLKNVNEKSECIKARKSILSKIDWKCKLITLFMK